MDRSSPEAVRTMEKFNWNATPSVFTSSRQPLPSTLTLAPVSNKPVNCLLKASTSAKGLGSAESIRFTAATTSRRLDLLILKRKDPVPCLHIATKPFFLRSGPGKMELTLAGGLPT
ncbi:uncharacterized protein LOC122818937 [Drosophila biarmipes]|uniref:uncharacterized protein LOC122818937 n=1 Tax=Drosophila biarmipes TaxID=125945 RepID=UPI001CDAA5C3|nr:uncharacterized protein LOC122818937 [Drosophila biarmipes]